MAWAARSELVIEPLCPRMTETRTAGESAGGNKLWRSMELRGRVVRVVILPPEEPQDVRDRDLASGRAGGYREYVGTRSATGGGAGDLRTWSQTKTPGRAMDGGDRKPRTKESEDAYDAADLVSLAEAHGAEDRSSSSHAASRYSVDEVRTLVEQYAGLIQVIRWSHSAVDGKRLGRSDVLNRLLDLEEGLRRLEETFYAPLEWLGLRRLTAREAATLLRAPASTLHNRYLRGVETLCQLLNGEVSSRRRRTIPWRDWLQSEEQVRLPRTGKASTDRNGVRGRPPQIPTELEDRIVDMYRGGMTLRSIADALDEEGISAPGGGVWRPTSFRSLLQRRRVPVRPRGRTPRPGTHRPEDITRTDF
jgi:hypothetical protein